MEVTRSDGLKFAELKVTIPQKRGWNFRIISGPGNQVIFSDTVNFVELPSKPDVVILNGSPENAVLNTTIKIQCSVRSRGVPAYDLDLTIQGVNPISVDLNSGYIVTKTYRAEIGLQGKQIECAIGGHKTFYPNRVNVIYGPTPPVIRSSTGRLDNLLPGDFLECVSHSNPAPSYTWKALTDVRHNYVEVASSVNRLIVVNVNKPYPITLSYLCEVTNTLPSIIGNDKVYRETVTFTAIPGFLSSDEDMQEQALNFTLCVVLFTCVVAIVLLAVKWRTIKKQMKIPSSYDANEKH
jgi:hypothetical protein